MQKIERVLAFCNDYKQCDMVIGKCARLAKTHDAGVTLMYVHEHALFELPFFTQEELLDHERVKRELMQKAREHGIEEPAVLVYENDTPDHVALESQREADTLVVTGYAGEVTAETVKRATVPVLVLKEGPHIYANAVVAIDAVMPERCLKFMHRFFEGTKPHLYLDFQYVPIPSVDPVVEPLDTGMDATIYTELLEAKREAFEAFCQEKGLEGIFEIGENGIAEDTTAFVEKRGAELLVLAPLDKDTVLGDATGDILERASTDILICFEASVAS